MAIGEEISFLLNDQGTMIVSMNVTDLTTPLGDFASLAIPVSIPIDEDGSFSDDFDPLNVGLAMIHLEGQFEGDVMSASFSVEVGGIVECAGTVTAQGAPPPPRPPTTFSGSIEPAERNCGNGGISVTVSGDGLSVIGLEIEEFSVHGASASGSATFAEGTVPIAEDGSFGWVYFPGSELGQEIAVIGTVRFATVSGAVTFSPSTCGAVPFVSVNPLSLGQGGSGAMSDSGLPFYWALAAGAFGIASLAIGAAVWRRVQ
ncbi:MAG: hypothetical protein IIB87_06195 [Chloroflexi bacterium]|nr:hypothetical protein [Chloroflexota bacterium]